MWNVTCQTTLKEALQKVTQSSKDPKRSQDGLKEFPVLLLIAEDTSQKKTLLLSNALPQPLLVMAEWNVPSTSAPKIRQC